MLDNRVTFQTVPDALRGFTTWFETHSAPQVHPPLHFILEVSVKQGGYVRPIEISPRVLRG